MILKEILRLLGYTTNKSIGIDNKGHGLVDLSYTIDGDPFFSVVDMCVTLSKEFERYLTAYDAHLINNKEAISELLV